MPEDIGLRMMGRASRFDELVDRKHREYVGKARLFAMLYYGSRLLAGLSAAMLPFVVNAQPAVATALAATIAVVTVVDLVFSPREKWTVFSKATDLIVLARLKASGEYDRHREAFQVILEAEAANLGQLKDLDELLRRINEPAVPTPQQ